MINGNPPGLAMIPAYDEPSMLGQAVGCSHRMRSNRSGHMPHCRLQVPDLDKRYAEWLDIAGEYFLVCLTSISGTTVQHIVCPSRKARDQCL
jgi:hypothetical protein